MSLLGFAVFELGMLLLDWVEGVPHNLIICAIKKKYDASLVVFFVCLLI